MADRVEEKTASEDDGLFPDEGERVPAGPEVGEAEVLDADTLDDIDRLLDDVGDPGAGGASADSDRVILEEVQDADEPATPGPSRRRIPGKPFWAVLAAVCVLGAGGNFFLGYHGRKSAEKARPQVWSFPVIDIPASTPFGSGEALPLSVNLKSFLVPAPMARKDMTYVTADVAIELTTQKAAALVKANAPFYRNIIYEVMKAALTSADTSKIDEISLKIDILKALTGSVPERSVKDVIVEAFVMY